MIATPTPSPADALSTVEVDRIKAVVSGVGNAGAATSWRGSALTAFFGDSLTNDVTAGVLGAQEYSTHAIYGSGGRITFGGKFGEPGMGYFVAGVTTGKTFAQAKADLLAASPKPTRVSVLLGTNDIGSGARSFAEVRDQTIEFAAWLEANGFEVVLSQMPPRNDALADAALRLKLHTFNAWVTRYGAITGRRVNRFYEAGADRAGGGGWTTGRNRDSIHPNYSGAQTLGAAHIAATATTYVAAPYLAYDNGDATGLLNALMLTDARTNGGSAEVAADGIPDWWGKANSTPATLTHALTSGGSEAFGNWWKMVVGAGTNIGPTIRSHKIAAAVGDVIQIACRLKTVVPANGAGISIAAWASDGTSWITANGSTVITPVSIASSAGQSAQAYSVDTIVAVEATVVRATAQGVSVDVTPYNHGLAGGDIYIGQFTLRNLTALGIA